MAADPLVARLRTAGCVYAEEEAALLREAADGAGRPALDRLVDRRVAGEPLEHVVGWVELGGRRLSVGPGVFIPRQRTRLLARRALEALPRRPGAVLVEAYAGVAPVAATVAAGRPDAEVHACDHDPAALAYARANLADHPRARTHLGDGLAALPDHLTGRVDVLAAVPPYVPDDARGLLPHGADHEPDVALLGGADGLDHVRRLLAATDLLSPEGCVLVELHRDQAVTAAAYAGARGLAVRTYHGDDGQTAVLEVRQPHSSAISSKWGASEVPRMMPEPGVETP